MDTTYIAGAGMTRFGKFPNTSLAGLANEAVDAALTDAGVRAEDVGFVAFGNATSSVITGQAMIQGQLALLDGALAGARTVNVENACASSSSALHLAMMAVASGSCDVALAVGAEKMSHPDKTRAFDALGRAIDISDPLVSESPSRNSIFMDLYAQEARRYAAETGAPVEAFARTASTVHYHGSLNPNAQHRHPHSPEEILASRMIVEPLTLLMCSPIGDGAAAVIVTRDRPSTDPIAITGAALQSGRRREGGQLVTRTAKAALEQAGRKAADADVIELHDAAAPAALVILEELGAVGRGEAWKLAMEGELRHDGRLPVNTSGGLISRGHPVGATGTAQIVELVDQLRGRAGDRQVSDAQFALAQNAGGAVTLDDPYTAAVCAVTVLERV
ncbi:thiolase family protein [Streptomyces sp. PSKA54]|uniref:propanoyl-CoA C-acyltransferase n=1 Tax=Streptomyces himalayensis subsp. aureolus TaxID=2758039 RepID=A0A7W2HKP4_9ACTN|nr:thiolase family protein [Streptomyces himalayensis]MBA4867149.1 thiolase family protein [Streptomyces himalayensis subsp. aureolus]